MSNQIQVLKQTELLGQQFAVYGSSDKPFFLAKDITDMLSLTNHREVVTRVDEEERCKFNLHPQGETWFLTEDGLYEVLMQSRKPIAKQFKKAVKVILKEIRITGGYITSSETDTPEVIMARALQVANETLQRHKQRVQMLEGQTEIQQEQIKQLEPKAQYTDEVLQSTTTYTLTQIAHDLGMRSVHVLTNLLKEKGILYKQSGQWQPTAKVADKQMFETRTTKFVKSDNTVGTNIYTVVTETGRMHLHNLLRKEIA